MCYSCHNGIVVDDRRTLWSGRHHPASGKVTCGSCHTPHVQAPNVRPFMRYPQGSYAFCTTCHPGRRAGDTGEHPAVAAEKGQAQDCGGCHAVHRAQGDGLIRAASAESLCGPCHGENPSRAGRGPGMATHVIGKSGPPCLGCHDVHKTVGGKMLLDKAALDGRLCRQCHERNFSPGKAEANHPVAPDRAICLSCHRMHNAEKPGARRGLLAVAWAEPDTICRRCHADVAGPGKGGVVEPPAGASVAGDERALGARLAQVRRVLRARGADHLPLLPPLPRGSGRHAAAGDDPGGALPLLPPGAELARPRERRPRGAPDLGEAAAGAHRRVVHQGRRERRAPAANSPARPVTAPTGAAPRPRVWCCRANPTPACSATRGKPRSRPRRTAPPARRRPPRARQASADCAAAATGSTGGGSRSARPPRAGPRSSGSARPATGPARPALPSAGRRTTRWGWRPPPAGGLRGCRCSGATGGAIARG